MPEREEDRYQRCLDQAKQASSGGRYEEALAWVSEALRANPDGAEARNERGELLWEQCQPEEALRDFTYACEVAPDYYTAHLNRLELLIEEFNDSEEALELADELLAGSLDRDVESEVYYLKAKALFYLEDLEGSLFLLRRALQVQGELPVYRAFEGQILFEMGRMAEARHSLERARGMEPDAPHTLYHLALITEHEGNHLRAEQLFEQAERGQPDLYPRPVRIEPAEFQATAEQAVRALPEQIQNYVANCPIIIEDLPGPSLIREYQIPPTLLGLFLGTPVTEPGYSPTMGTGLRVAPDKILLFKRNLEKVATSRADLIEQIQITVKHELAHYLGLDEDEVERLGLA
jgi:predicted Zn-dependent protease with MMP-like domain/Flp pilus assembly protein TadD